MRGKQRQLEQDGRKNIRASGRECQGVERHVYSELRPREQRPTFLVDESEIAPLVKLTCD